MVLEELSEVPVGRVEKKVYLNDPPRGLHRIYDCNFKDGINPKNVLFLTGQSVGGSDDNDGPNDTTSRRDDDDDGQSGIPSGATSAAAFTQGAGLRTYASRTSGRPGSGNIGARKFSLKKKAVKKTQTKTLTQAVLNLGQRKTISCGVCDVTYNVGDAEDMKVHELHHKKFLSLLLVPSQVMKLLEVVDAANGIYKVSSEARASKVYTNWESSIVVMAEKAMGGAGIEIRSKHDCYFALSNAGALCGLLICERLDSGKVGYPVTASANGVVEVDRTTQLKDLVLGVSRIWVRPAYRRKGKARQMLNAMCKKSVYGVDDIDKSAIAFTQPTEGGVKLANNFFGSNTGWAVYEEDDF